MEFLGQSLFSIFVPIEYIIGSFSAFESENFEDFGIVMIFLRRKNFYLKIIQNNNPGSEIICFNFWGFVCPFWGNF